MSNELTINDITKTASIDEVVLFIDGSIKRTTEQVLETGYGFYILKEVCEREKQDFVELVNNRYNISKTNASRWVKIGSQYNLLMKYKHILPSNYSTIYSLLTLPKKGFEELVKTKQIHPALTFEMAEHYKAIYKADNKAKKEIKKEEKQNLDVNPFAIEDDDDEEEQVEVIKKKEETTKEKEPDIIDGEFTEVKPSKKGKKVPMTVAKAVEVLEIDLDNQFILARKANKYSDDELIQAVGILSGEINA